jgi:hypothetical protein
VKWEDIALRRFKVLFFEEIYMQSKQDKETAKQAYEKPRLRAIELAAEEVLGGPCKLADGAFASGATPCTANGCEQVGT